MNIVYGEVSYQQGPTSGREMTTTAKVGSARVSTRGQNDDSQVDELTAYGVDRLFIDHGVSGKHASRHELDKTLAYLREGDVFVITRLSAPCGPSRTSSRSPRTFVSAALAWPCSSSSLPKQR